MLSRGAVHDRQIRSAFVQFCRRHGSGSGSGICAATGLPHKSATCTGTTRTLEPQIMPTTRETSIFRRNSRLNIVVPLFDYLSAPNAPLRRVVAITSTLATVSERLRRGPKVVSSRAELIHRNVCCGTAKQERPPESGQASKFRLSANAPCQWTEESLPGTRRTCRPRLAMSGFGGNAEDICSH
jgi:hypothetical protein